SGGHSQRVFAKDESKLLATGRFIMRSHLRPLVFVIAVAAASGSLGAPAHADELLRAPLFERRLGRWSELWPKSLCRLSASAKTLSFMSISPIRISLSRSGSASRREVRLADRPDSAPNNSARIRRQECPLSAPDRRCATPLRDSPPGQTG